MILLTEVRVYGIVDIEGSIARLGRRDAVNRKYIESNMGSVSIRDDR